MSENHAAEQQTAHQQAETNQQQPGRAGGQATASSRPAPLQELFNPEELKQFDADDTKVGSVIGKMLAIFFLYTLIAMSLVLWWTYRAISQ